MKNEDGGPLIGALYMLLLLFFFSGIDNFLKKFFRVGVQENLFTFIVFMVLYIFMVGGAIEGLKSFWKLDLIKRIVVVFLSLIDIVIVVYGFG